MALGQLTVRLGLDAADFVRGMSRSEAEAQRLSKQMATDLGNAIGTATIAFTALAAAGVGAFKLISDTTESIAKFQDLAEKVGDTAENFASLKLASDVSGVSLDSVAAASVKLTAALSKTDEDGQGAAKAIKALGLNFDDFKKQSPADQMDTVAKSLAGFEDGANKTAVAVALFGKSGADLLPFLNDLADGSERQISLTGDQIKAANDFSESMAKLGSEMNTLKQQLVAQLIPTLADLAKLFTSAGDEVDASGKKAKPFAGVMAFIADEIRKTVADTYAFIGGIKQLGAGLSGFVANVKANLSGNFEEARRIATATKAEIAAIGKEYDALANKARSAGDGGRGKGFSDPRLVGAAPTKPSLVFDAIKTKPAKAAGGADKQSEADKYLASLQKQLEATDKLTVTAALLRDIDLGRLGVVLPAQQAELLLIAQKIDAVKANELAEKTASDAKKVIWDLEKKSILENFKSFDEAAQKKAEIGEALRQSVMTEMEQIIAQEQLYNQYLTNSTITLETYNRLMDQLQVRVTALDAPFKTFKEMGTSAAQSLADGLANAIVQGKSLADVFKNVIKQLAAMILKALFFKAIEIGLNAVGARFGAPGLGTAIAGKRAGGGNVNKGSSYLVGEKGPERFTPSESGRITTNANTFKQQSGGGGQMTNVYNITAPGVSREEFTAGLNRSQQGAISDVRQNKLRRVG